TGAALWRRRQCQAVAAVINIRCLVACAVIDPGAAKALDRCQCPAALTEIADMRRPRRIVRFRSRAGEEQRGGVANGIGLPGRAAQAVVDCRHERIAWVRWVEDLRQLSDRTVLERRRLLEWVFRSHQI